MLILWEPFLGHLLGFLGAYLGLIGNDWFSAAFQAHIFYIAVFLMTPYFGVKTEQSGCVPHEGRSSLFL